MAISDRIAVMNRGSIVQLGDAETLYRHPASGFVAEFIGRSNLLPATVLAATAGEVRLAVAGTEVAIAMTDGGLAPGAAVRVVLRPEAIGVGPVGADTVPGVVRGRTYLGEKVEYRVDVAGTLLHAVAFDPAEGQVHAPGARVGVRLPRRGVQILPETTP